MKLTPHLLIQAAESLPRPGHALSPCIVDISEPVHQLIEPVHPTHTVTSSIQCLVFIYDKKVDDWVLWKIVDGFNTYELHNIV